ncbi:MAG: zinc-dependent metalloprotease, partial [Bacteroidota bacterium]
REELMPQSGVDFRDEGDCIRIYVESEYDLFQNKGSEAAVVSFLTGAMNQNGALYANENIATSVSQIFVWTTNTDPYDANNSSGYLSDFQNFRNDWDGDLAMLVNLRNIGGVAAGFNGLCNNNRDNSMCYSGINSTYQDWPSYSWTIDIIAHELGHLFGSRHTHACVWNGNGTAIDGCYFTEGSCPDPGYPDAGTVMSYCHLNGRPGKDLALGFGPQPGNVIRGRVASAGCLGTSCSTGGGGPTCDDGIQNGDEEGVDCGGSNCAPCAVACQDTEVTISLTLDNYGAETTWTLTDANGQTVESGGPYTNGNDGQVVTVSTCLPDGCYDFSINDSFGDGICCNYGNGSYTITDANGTVLASGGDFNSTETKNFCLGDVAPTCEDGVQNGSETGVDCGGPDCPACPAEPTCTDGVQNGNETGVDCGGPDCPACPTCNDGIQNGDETGVDCGGSCAPCDNGGGCTDVVVSIVLDRYGSETTWSITNASGETVASGGPYSNNQNGVTVTGSACLPDGCYDFTINDSFGDGICCSYGNGSYTVTAGGSVMATGGNFNSTETKNFCFGDGTNPEPTCNDGVQNGDETGVDCGGSCAPCDGGGGDCLSESENFENGFGIWNDGGSDCARINNSSIATSGSFSVRLRDNSVTSVVTTDDLDLSSAISLTVSFNYEALSMENGEDFWLQISTNGGASYSTVEDWVRGIDFDNGEAISESVTVTGPFSANTRVRFRNDASSNSDYIYIDDVQLSANCGAGQPMTDLNQPFGKSINERAKAQIVNLYPNPTRDRLVVQYNLAKAETVQLIVTDFTGKTLQEHQVDALEGSQRFELNASDLNSGFYFVHLVSGDQRTVKKFIVAR